MVEARLSGGEIEQHGAAIDDRRGAIVGLELGLWSLDWSSGFAGEVSLSFSLSLSLQKCFEVKIGIENNFQGQSLIFTVN